MARKSKQFLWASKKWAGGVLTAANKTEARKKILESLGMKRLPSGTRIDQLSAEQAAENPQLIDKFRPERLEDLVGAGELIKYITRQRKRKDYDRDRLLFTGLAGTGKTTAARIVAKMFATDPRDLREVQPGTDAASNIELARDIKRDLQFAPWKVGDWTVWIINEAHNLSGAAREVFLDILENLPARRMFILTTSKPQTFDLAFRRRVQTFAFEPLTGEELAPLVIRVAKSEGRKVSMAQAREIGAGSEGSAGQAIQLLERFLNTGTLPTLPEGATGAPTRPIPRSRPPRRPAPRSAAPMAKKARAGRASRKKAPRRVAKKKAAKRVAAKDKPQALFFSPKKWTPATARAWLREKGFGKPKSRIRRSARGVPKGWFGWDLKSIPKGSRVRFKMFGPTIRARFAFKGPAPKKKISRKKGKKAPTIRRSSKKVTLRNKAAITKAARQIIELHEAGEPNASEFVRRSRDFSDAAWQKVLERAAAGRKNARANRSAKKNAGIQKTAKGWRVVHSVTKQPLTGTFRGRDAKDRARKRAREICQRAFPKRQEGAKCRINAKNRSRDMTAAGLRRRAEFMKFNDKNPHVDLETRQIADVTIPDGMVLIGGYAQVNYISDKDGGHFAEFFHRPPQVGREGALASAANKGRKSGREGGDVLLHPKGAYLLILPPPGKRITMDRRGLLN